MAVLLFHGFGATFHQPITGLLEPVRASSSWGWLGVELFFVISGFCIFSRLAISARARESAGGFFWDRALRVFPLYWAALAASIVVGLAAMPLNRTPLSNNVPTTLHQWIADIFLLQPWIGGGYSLFVAWSLAYEISFYAVCALLLLTARPERPWQLPVIGGGVLVIVAWLTPGSHPAIGPLHAWPMFFCGGLVFLFAETRKNQSAKFLPALAIVGILVIGAGSALTPYGSKVAGIVSAGFALLLVVLMPWDTRIASARLLAPLMGAGIISYSLYLVHGPVISRFNNLGMRWFPPETDSYVILWVSVITMSIAASWIFHHLAERPLEVWRRKLVARRVPALSRSQDIDMAGNSPNSNQITQ